MNTNIYSAYNDKVNPLSRLTLLFLGNITARLVVTATIFVVICSSANAQLYRYKNEEGVVVIEDKIPPEFVAKGYDILQRDGTLVRRVERQRTQEELEQQISKDSEKRLRKEEERRLQEWDASLLRRYSSEEDIQAAQERAKRDLQMRVSILKSNLNTIKSQIEREQKKAADIERRGGQVPEAMSKNIDILRLEIEDTEHSIAARHEEIAAVNAAFERDLERFRTLLDRVKMRRQQAPSASEEPPKRSRY